jgi:hypothetical protein
MMSCPSRNKMEIKEGLLPTEGLDLDMIITKKMQIDLVFQY